MNKTETSRDSAAAVCRWCKNELGETNCAGKDVCSRCYRLLRDAGVSEEEILHSADERR